MNDAERMLIQKALRFAVWAAGQGIAPVDGEPARDPEEFLTDYSAETDDEDWETLPERIIDALSAPEAQQEPVAWQLRYGYGPWACEITMSREVVDRWVRDGHGFRPLYARPALEPAPEAQQERPSEPAVTDAMELARAVLARVMTAGYPNAPGPDPEDVEKAFWALDDALKATVEAPK